MMIKSMLNDYYLDFYFYFLFLNFIIFHYFITIILNCFIIIVILHSYDYFIKVLNLLIIVTFTNFNLNLRDFHFLNY